MRFPLKVTRADIRDGDPGSECNCPIARAADRHLSPEYSARVSADGQIRVVCASAPGTSGTLARSALSKERARFIDAFDMQSFDMPLPKPFTSIVDLPVRVLRPSTVKKFRRNRK